MERDGITRLVAYLREVREGHSHTSSYDSRVRDFKTFFTQYDMRRKKSFTETFPKLKEWYESIPETNIEPLKNFVDGDSTKGWTYVEELVKRANTEGWVLKPASENPGGQNYVEPKEGI
jgi:hypothetical protein